MVGKRTNEDEASVVPKLSPLFAERGATGHAAAAPTSGKCAMRALLETAQKFQRIRRGGQHFHCLVATAAHSWTWELDTEMQAD
eukprot:3264330-Pleurochrysis_carterae.AAC.1